MLIMLLWWAICTTAVNLITAGQAWRATDEIFIIHIINIIVIVLLLLLFYQLGYQTKC